MKQYEGTRHPYGCVVEVVAGESRKLLNPRFDLRRHSPDGFEWGYGGSGPSQLALALCADALEDDALALACYQEYKRGVMRILKEDTFIIYQREVKTLVAFIHDTWPESRREMKLQDMEAFRQELNAKKEEGKDCSGN
jgi:hypothetical protein